MKFLNLSGVVFTPRHAGPRIFWGPAKNPRSALPCRVGRGGRSFSPPPPHSAPCPVWGSIFMVFEAPFSLPPVNCLGGIRQKFAFPARNCFAIAGPRNRQLTGGAKTGPRSEHKSSVYNILKRSRVGVQECTMCAGKLSGSSRWLLSLDNSLSARCALYIHICPAAPISVRPSCFIVVCPGLRNMTASAY